MFGKKSDFFLLHEATEESHSTYEKLVVNLIV